MDLENRKDICHRLWYIHLALKGLGGLFEQQQVDPSYSEGELFGIGKLLKSLAAEVSETEELLRADKKPTS